VGVDVQGQIEDHLHRRGHGRVMLERDGHGDKDVVVM
jgi:hypothetical protein